MNTAVNTPANARRRNARRAFCILVSLLAVAAFFAGCTFQRPAQEPAPRPNILVIISDDQSWSPTGATYDPVARTPAMDRLAREGVVFSHAFVAAPSCSPSRAALLTGQAVWRLGAAADQGGALDAEFPVYPDLLQLEGYHVGYAGKGWSPGNLAATGRSRNPAGEDFNRFGPVNLVANFEAFMDSVPAGTPFCFWWGSSHPHRPFAPGGGAGELPGVVVPPIWPDVVPVRQDIARYLGAVRLFDDEIALLMEILAARGHLENTLVVVTSDNGMPFPCAKATLYDRGTRVPLLVWWPGFVPGGRVVDDLVSLTDLAPTFLEAAGRKPPGEMTGRSLMGLLRSAATGRTRTARDFVVTARERHADSRTDGLGYPSRAMRTYDFLYIRNYAPERWPAGNPPLYGDIDSWNQSYSAPTKDFILERRNAPDVRPLFDRCFEKRPAEELYDLALDPHEMFNVLDSAFVAADSGKNYEKVRRDLARRLGEYLKQTEDPRATGDEIPWDRPLAKELP